MSTDKILMFYFTGMFMVKVTFLSDSGKILASSERSVSLRFLSIGISLKILEFKDDLLLLLFFPFFSLIVWYAFDFFVSL